MIIHRDVTHSAVVKHFNYTVEVFPSVEDVHNSYDFVVLGLLLRLDVFSSKDISKVPSHTVSNKVLSDLSHVPFPRHEWAVDLLHVFKSDSVEAEPHHEGLGYLFVYVSR